MQKSLLLLFATLLTSFLSGLTAKASQSSTSSSYVSEILEWRNNKDGSSKILMECMPGRVQLWSRDIDNKWLRRVKSEEVLKRLDKECQEALK